MPPRPQTRSCKNVGTGRFKPVVAAIAVYAAVIGELLGVASEIHLIVGLVERAEGGDQLAFLIALEASSRDGIEDAIGAVAIGGGIAAALRLQVIDILGIDLRADVAGDVGVGNRNAVDSPGNLVSAAHVKLIVGHPCARNVIGDRGQAVAQIGARAWRRFRCG